MGNLVSFFPNRSMKLYIVASNKNRLNEAILIDYTMYSVIECYRFTSNCLYYLEPWIS